MQRYLGPAAFAVEVGAGAGFSERFLRAGRLELTDAEPHPWVARVVDATELPYADASVDVLIASNVIHHLAYPDRFLREAARVLRQDGYLLVQECNVGKTTEWALRLTGHEGYDWSAYPFDRSEEHTSELQSQSNLVCRLLLEKKIPDPLPHPMHE